MTKLSIVNATTGVLASDYYNKGAKLAPSGTPQGRQAVPMGSYMSAPEPVMPQVCILTTKKGTPCKAPVVKNTELCVGHTRQLAKAAQGV